LSGERRPYSLTQISLHWLIAGLVIAQYATSGAIKRTHEVHGGLAPDPTDLLLHTVHNRVGLLIGLVMLVRLVLRLKNGSPPTPEGTPPWQAKLANAVHWAFYAVIFMQVGTGFIASYLWWPASAAHGPLFILLLLLIFVHVFAAFWHQWVRKDGLLRRMLP
jgi:cytochrome b561